MNAAANEVRRYPGGASRKWRGRRSGGDSKKSLRFFVEPKENFQEISRRPGVGNFVESLVGPH